MPNWDRIGQQVLGFGEGYQGRGQQFLEGLEDKRKEALVTDAFTVMNQMTNQDYAGARSVLINRLEAIKNLGGDPSDTDRVLYKLEAGDYNGVYNDTKSVVDMAIQTGKFGAGLPAEIRAFNTMTQGLTQDEIDHARRIRLGLDPRAVGSASQTITSLGSAPEVADTERVLAAGKETGTLEAQLKLKPGVEAAVTKAVREATMLADMNQEQRTNETTFAVYDTGMSRLITGMDSTLTGPFIGMVPAVTANQQIADGAIAAMAPVMKQMFRAAGEGIFTDKDQELLLNMIPSRKDHPEARAAKLEMIDAIVRAKLRISMTPQQQTGFPASRVGRFTVEAQ